MNKIVVSALWRLNRYFSRRNYLKQILLFYLFSWAMTFLFIPLIYVTEDIWGQGDDRPDLNKWFLAIFIAPIIETLINQLLVFKILHKIPFTKGKQVLIIVISAFIFGLFHNYNLGYMIFGFSMGLVFAYVFYFYHHSTQKAFWSTALIHCLRNLTATFFMLLS